MGRPLLTGAFISLLGLSLLAPITQGADTMVADGKTVKIDYTLTVDGQVIDTSKGKEPLEYVQGQGMLISGLEKELTGMKAGDSKQVTVAPADAYGEISEEAFQEIPRSQLPPDMTPEVGQILGMQTPDGKQLQVVIAEVKEDTVVMNFNHPLAGKELNFDVTVVSVN